MRSSEAGISKQVAELLYSIDHHASLDTGSRILPDGSILSVIYSRAPSLPTAITYRSGRWVSTPGGTEE